MKIAILSDLHNEFGVPYRPTNSVLSADVVVLAGDIDLGTRGAEWALNTFEGKQLVYVAGNHEFYNHVFEEVVKQLMTLDAKNDNFHFLNPRSVDIGDVRFIGGTLWTDFGGDPANAAICKHMINDFNYIRRSGDLPFETKYVEQLNNLHKSHIIYDLTHHRGKKNVVVTHFAPSFQSIHPRFAGNTTNHYFATHLDSIIEDLKPDLWIHGHVHNHFDYMIGDTRVIANPRGYVRSQWHDTRLYDPNASDDPYDYVKAEDTGHMTDFFVDL